MQKLLYFIQAYYLCFTEEHKPCFKEKIEVWDIGGVVVPVVQKEFQHYSSLSIPYIDKYISEQKNIADIKFAYFDDNIISNKDKKIINGLIDKFKNYTSVLLGKIISKQKPYISAYNNPNSKEITHQSIKDYFIKKDIPKVNNVLDVARYVINYSNRKDYGISNLKLQKILYLIQAYFLAFTDEHQPCFKEKIVAWDFGVVVPVAFNEYKQFGSTDIPTVKKYIQFNENNDIASIKLIDYDENVLSDDCKSKINIVVDRFSEFTATDLVTLTTHQKPWRDAYIPNMNEEVTNEAIRDYFMQKS